LLRTTNQQEGAMRDYTGKTIYVGIDVHKKTYSCVSICNNEVIKRDTMPGDPEVLVKYLKRAFEGGMIYSAYEAGFSGFHLHKKLLSEGIENIVINAASIEISTRDRVKTDKRDALKIATQLSVGRLKGVYVPDKAQEERRSVTRLRAQAMKLRGQVGNQFKALLYQQGEIELSDDRVISKKWIDEKVSQIKNRGYGEDFIFTVEHYQKKWIQLNDEVKEIEKRMKEQKRSDPGLQMIYESVPGIGSIHARQLINELGDMKQFKNAKGLFSYTGLTPCEYSSGENIRQGHISRQGKSTLRKILVEAAWVAIRRDGELEEIFNRISQQRGKKRAIVAVARNMVGRIRACVASGNLYEIRPRKEKKEMRVEKEEQKSLHGLAVHAVAV